MVLFMLPKETLVFERWRPHLDEGRLAGVSWSDKGFRADKDIMCGHHDKADVAVLVPYQGKLN